MGRGNRQYATVKNERGNTSNDAWTCECGNTASDSGFECWDVRHGRTTDASIDGPWDELTWFCNGCEKLVRDPQFLFILEMAAEELDNREADLGSAEWDEEERDFHERLRTWVLRLKRGH